VNFMIKKLFPLTLALGLWTLNCRATPVYFPLLSITGNAENRTAYVVPDPSTSPLIYGSNLVVAPLLTLYPVGGAATNNLLPWAYTLHVNGTAFSAHFVVPQSTNLINVTSLITNGVALGFPVSFGSTSGFSGIITNLAPLTLATNYNCTITGSGGSFIFGTGPTISVSSNYIVSGSVIVDGAFIWNGTQWVNSSVSPNATLGQSTGFWVFFKPSVGNPSISSSVGAYTSPPDTIQTWNNGGWIANGGVLPWSSLIVTNISHVNITSFTNGVCSTNIFQ